MRIGGGTAVLLVALALGGCASVDVSTQSSPTATLEGLRHFDWEPRIGESSVAAGLETAGRALVEAALVEKGYRLASANRPPDFLIAFYVQEETETVRLVDEDVEYGNPDEPRETTQAAPQNPEEPRPQPPSKSANPAGFGVDPSFEDDLVVGEVLVRAMDPHTRAPIWAGRGRGTTNPKSPEREFEKILTQVIGRFPPSSSP